MLVITSIYSWKYHVWFSLIILLSWVAWIVAYLTHMNYLPQPWFHIIQLCKKKQLLIMVKRLTMANIWLISFFFVDYLVSHVYCTAWSVHVPVKSLVMWLSLVKYLSMWTRLQIVPVTYLFQYYYWTHTLLPHHCLSLYLSLSLSHSIPPFLSSSPFHCSFQCPFLCPFLSFCPSLPLTTPSALSK